MAYQRFKTAPSKFQLLAYTMKKYKNEKNKNTDKKQVRRICLWSAIIVHLEDLNI